MDVFRVVVFERVLVFICIVEIGLFLKIVINGSGKFFDFFNLCFDKRVSFFFLFRGLDYGGSKE